MTQEIWVKHAQAKLDSLPESGTIAPEYDKRISFSIFFECDNFHIHLVSKVLINKDDKLVLYYGATLKVWIDNHRYDEMIIHPYMSIETFIPLLELEARAKCDHKGAKERPYNPSRMHEHIYDCPKCKETYSTDSSD